MSTCQGAPAPHDDCPHGQACDWEGRPDYRGKIVRLSTKDGAPANRAERRAWAKRHGVKPSQVIRP